MKSRGTLLLSGSYWLIAADADCLGRLKRWLPRADPRAVGQLRVKRSPEIDADIEAALERFPLDADPKHRAQLHAGAEVYRRQGERVEGLAEGTITPRDFSLARGTPRLYQRIGAEHWLAVGRYLLGDGLGTGKTVTSMCGLTDPSNLPAVVVCPKHLASQWIRCLGEWLPQLRTHILEGVRPYDIAQRAAQQDARAGRTPRRALPDVLVTTYDRIPGWATTLAPDVGTPLVRSMILDECAAIRHHATERWTFVRHVSDRISRVLGMDGYAIGGYGAEIFNVIDAISPGALGSREEFHREHCVVLAKDGAELPITSSNERKARLRDPNALGLYLRRSGLMLRRTAADVGVEMPEVTYERIQLDYDRAEWAKHRRELEALANTTLAGPTSSRAAAGMALDTAARKATGIIKARPAAEFIRSLVEAGERVVVGAWHQDVHRILAEELSEWAPAFVVGAESARAVGGSASDKAREESIRRYKAKETPILVISNRSGDGLDGLQYLGRIVVEVELDWSPRVHDQLRGRVYRPGQTASGPVVIYSLEIDDGSDPSVAEVLFAKRANSSPVIDPKAGADLAAESVAIHFSEVPEADRARMLAEAMRAKR